MGPDIFTQRVFGVPQEGAPALNPTGALAVAAIALLALGVFFDAAL